jgi:hypothetical protein
MAVDGGGLLFQFSKRDSFVIECYISRRHSCGDIELEMKEMSAHTTGESQTVAVTSHCDWVFILTESGLTQVFRMLPTDTVQRHYVLNKRRKFSSCCLFRFPLHHFPQINGNPT